jgi:plastocyanin
MQRSLHTALAVAALALTLGATPAAAASTVQVSSRTMSYDASVVAVAGPGGSVKWTNVTSPSRSHDVVSSLPAYFDSPLSGSGGTFQFNFAAAGYFTYICSIHDSMLGAVSVPMLGATVDVGGITHFKLTIGVAKLPAASPYRYVLLRQLPGEAALTYWKTTRSAIVDVVPVTAGDYVYAARLKHIPSGRPSGTSPTVTLNYAPPAIR